MAWIIFHRLSYSSAPSNTANLAHFGYFLLSCPVVREAGAKLRASRMAPSPGGLPAGSGGSRQPALVVRLSALPGVGPAVELV
jgi:hypothetical protein